MRTKLGWGYLMAVLICGPALAQSARTPEAMLGAALHQERVTGDLQAAIDGYQKVLATGGVPSSVAAQAQYHIGLCYEKLGNQEARSAFEAVIRDYADEAEIVRQAQTRLAAMRADAPDAPVFRRVWSGQGVDTEGTVSSDGRYLSFPDWPTGNLALRDLVTGTNRNLTNDGSNSQYAERSVISPGSTAETITSCAWHRRLASSRGRLSHSMPTRMMNGWLPMTGHRMGNRLPSRLTAKTALPSSVWYPPRTDH
jgi:hypothetical protein